MHRGPAVNVLIVDDNVDFCTSTADLLAVYGHRAAYCTDGQAALHYLRSHRRPRVILLDWLMPAMSGEQFLLELFADPRLECIPVIIVTGYHGARPAPPSPGRYPVLLKPVEIHNLLPVIETYVRPPQSS